MFLHLSVILFTGRVSVQGVSLSRGVSIQGGLCPVGLCQGDTPHHHMVMCGRYVSYWNPFLLILLSLINEYACDSVHRESLCSRSVSVQGVSIQGVSPSRGSLSRGSLSSWSLSGRHPPLPYGYVQVVCILLESILVDISITH